MLHDCIVRSPTLLCIPSPTPLYPSHPQIILQARVGHASGVQRHRSSRARLLQVAKAGTGLHWYISPLYKHFSTFYSYERPRLHLFRHLFSYNSVIFKAFLFIGWLSPLLILPPSRSWKCLWTCWGWNWPSRLTPRGLESMRWADMVQNKLK